LAEPTRFAKGVLCLDSANFIRFWLSGAGTLIGNLGRVRASRDVQLSHGHGEISMIRKGDCRIEAAVAGLPMAGLDL
jgi:beta-galactosidase